MQNDYAAAQSTKEKWYTIENVVDHLFIVFDLHVWIWIFKTLEKKKKWIENKSHYLYSNIFVLAAAHGAQQQIAK